MSSPNAPARAALSRDRILDAAIATADADGLDAVSMRRLAGLLGVTPMALYKHLENRDRLVDAMVDRVVGEIRAGAPDPEWKRAVRRRILDAREVAGRHSWLPDAIESRVVATPTLLAYLDDLIGIMLDGGLSADLVHHAMHALSVRMWGFTRDVVPMPALPDEPAARAQALATYAASYPSIIRMATTAPAAGAGCDADAEFAFALDLLLDGVERLHALGWASG